MELTQQEVMAILGEKELRIAAQAKHIAALEAKLSELRDADSTDHGERKLKSALGEVRARRDEAASAGE